MPKTWYAMRSKPNKEDFLAGQLEANGVDVFYPCLQVNPVNPRARKVRPYFPNYLFIRVDLDLKNASSLRWIPGASSLVSFDGVPASVPDLLIDAVKQQVRQLNDSLHENTSNFHPGDVILIQNGPFEGYEAIFDGHVSGRDRVRVLLDFLQKRQIPLELREQQIRHVKHP